MEKVCIDCKQKKKLEDFRGQRRRCKSCASKYEQTRIFKSRENFLRRRFVELQNRARRKKEKLPLKIEDLFDLFKKQKGLCAVTHLPMTWFPEDVHSNAANRRGTNISVDKINPDGIYEIDNIQLVCERVNKIKSNMNESELYFWTRQIAEHIINPSHEDD